MNTPTTNGTSQLKRMETHFGITPATALLLHRAGYHSPQSTVRASPKEVAIRICSLTDMDAMKAMNLLPTLRRIVLLGNISNVSEAAAMAEKYGELTVVELTRLGIWEEGFDDLNGMEILHKISWPPAHNTFQ